MTMVFSGCHDEKKPANDHEPELTQSAPDTMLPAEPPRADLAQDNPDFSRLQQLHADIQRSGGMCSPAQLETLEKMHEQYPASRAVFATLHGVYLGRLDWRALLALHESIPAAQRTFDEWKLLGKISIRAGKLKVAAEILSRLTAEQPDDLETARLAAHALYHLDRKAEAAAILDRDWTAHEAANDFDTLIIRGKLHQDAGENQRAIDLLQKAIAANPDAPQAYNDLARVYSALGDDQNASRYIAIGQQKYDKKTNEERRKLRLAAQSKQLLAARDAGEYAQCETIVEDMLRTADPEQARQLLTFLSGMFAQLQNDEKATEYQRRAAEIEGK